MSCEESKEESQETQAGGVWLEAGEYEALKREAEESRKRQDQCLRLTAEFDNARKRMERQRQDLSRFILAGQAEKLLPVVDDLDRALRQLEEEHQGEEFSGLKMLHQNLWEVLTGMGLKPLETVGKRFDPAKHEAIAFVEAEDCEEQSIAEEIRKGYELEGRVIRPAVVRVYKNISKEGNPDG
ncbi:MAG: nucleotide exchange factor GrpE [Candidatus Omnitrophica bacterium]|nr:nucleotide exchange factor GrpE [Candidatus Omnitrophota bacterium]